MAFLNHVKLKIFFAVNHGGQHRAPPFSKSLDPLLGFSLKKGHNTN